MGLWQRLRVDLARPEVPTSRDEQTFALIAPFVIVAVAQFTDPAPWPTLLVLVPAIVAFALRPVLSHYPAELFALAVMLPVAGAVGLDGDVEGTFFLSVLMVLYVAWDLGSFTRAVVITTVASGVAPFVAEVLAPDSGIAWQPWTTAHWFMLIMGRTLHRQRTLIDQLEAARQALAEQAVAEERRRIARELHDLAGHTLAAMVLHVTGARHVLRRDVDEAESALRDAEEVGRSSLDQIRLTVAALRTHERGTDPVLPDSADLDALLESYRRAGLTIDARFDGAATKLDGPPGVALHRIVRESLANVARHAPQNRVEVRLARHASDVCVVIIDRGRAGIAAYPPAVRPGAARSDDAHFGLIGMAERARALGGEFEAGPTPDGWRVAATLPIASISTARSSS